MTKLFFAHVSMTNFNLITFCLLFYVAALLKPGPKNRKLVFFNKLEKENP